MSRYKVGDRVVVRDDLVLFENYYMDDRKHFDSFVESMEKFMGKVVTIREANPPSGKYLIVESSLNWTDEMFAGLEEEVLGVLAVSVDDLI